MTKTTQLQFKKHLSRLIFPAVLLLIMLAAYALFLFRMGYYWDDWQAIYLFQFKSPQLYWDYFLGDRPISAWTFILFQPLLGTQAWHWQIATLLSRWLGIWLLTATFWRIWPSQKRTLQWMGLLLAVYPGFSQQNIAVAYHQHFTTFILFAASFYFMVRAQQSERQPWRWQLPAIFCAVLHMLTMEYFVGLEGLRPLLIYIILLNTLPEISIRSRLLKTLRTWLPYAGALGVFGIYRFLIYPAIRPGLEANSPSVLLNMFSQPVNAGLHLIELAVQDISHMLLEVWLNGLQAEAFQLSNKIVLFSWAVAILVGLGVFLVSKLFAIQSESKNNPPPAARQMLLIGLMAILFGGLPVWITDRQSIVGLWSDRFTLAPMLGVALFIAALTAWLVQEERKRAILFTALLILSLPVHIQTANKYRLNTEIQQDFYQQLAWRAPQIKSGTAFASAGLPFSYVGDYAVGFGINTLYGMGNGKTELPVWWFNAGRQWGIDAVMEMTPETKIDYQLRNLNYTGSVNKLVGLVYNPSRGCLRVLDPVYKLAPPMDDFQMHELNSALLEISHPQQILHSKQDLPINESVFGKENQQSWCYFYQKADLARQFADWQRISDLYQQSQTLQLNPQHGAELTPFILAAANQQEWVQAEEITRQAAALTPNMEPMLCALWQDLPQHSPPDSGQVTATAELREYLQCQ